MSVRMVSSVLQIIFFALLLQTDALKLTLNQDMTEIPRKLEPEEIGQFLHSIKDLPKLAEYLDPSRSPVNLDLLFFYNSYGCTEKRIFNWERISFIMTYGGLSRADRLILLNGECLMKWPDLFSVKKPDLTFLLSIIAESNPLLQIDESNNLNFWKRMRRLDRNGTWSALIQAAQFNVHLNFIPQITRLFKEKIIGPADLSPNGNYKCGLIGPELVESCFLASRKLSKRQECSAMILGPSRNQFSARDLFFWSLNIATVSKYDPSVRNVLRLRGHFDKLIELCQWHEVQVIYFLKQFSSLILHQIKKNSIDSEHILNIFRTLCFDDPQSPDPQAENENLLEPLLMSIEFYKWIDFNAEYYEIPAEVIKKSCKIIHLAIYTKKTLNNPDLYLKFLSSEPVGFNNHHFKKFLRNNYKPEKPTVGLLELFRKITWKNESSVGNVMASCIKSFLDLPVRLRLLRKRSFDHPSHFIENSSIELYFSEDSTIFTSIFEGVYEFLMEKYVLVFPLNVNVTQSAFVNGFFNVSTVTNLRVVLNKFWKCLGDFANGFFQVNFDQEIDSDFFKYASEFIPNPWTHPNILLAAGCTMTLAILHGIKLEGWSIKKSLIEAIFKILFSPPSKPEDFDEDADFNENEFDANGHLLEGNFIKFYNLTDFCDEIEAGINDEVISDVLDDLTSFPVEDLTRKYLTNYQMNIIESIYDPSERDSGSIWTSKIFLVLDSLNSSDDSASELYKRVKEQLTTSFNENQLKSLWRQLNPRRSSSYKHDNCRREMTRMQVYSLYLGLQPLTRFLKYQEAYELIFGGI